MLKCINEHGSAWFYNFSWQLCLGKPKWNPKIISLCEMPVKYYDVWWYLSCLMIDTYTADTLIE